MVNTANSISKSKAHNIFESGLPRRRIENGGEDEHEDLSSVRRV